MVNKKLFTSESVFEGHPDKMADKISDAILDSILRKDNEARVACETALTTGLVLIMGEVTTSASIDIKKIVRKTIKDIGYNNRELGFDSDSCSILVCLDKQSPDINAGVNRIKEGKIELGAGDQGIMFGYATNETPELMPLPIILCHKISKEMSLLRKKNILTYLRPDGKTQITVEYDEDGNPFRIDTIVISSQHDEKISQEQIYNDLTKHVISKIIPESLLDTSTKVLINPTGRFVTGGPTGDAGLTGRKVIVDTYGGYARHGGGAFSGKDPTKVDRSASYAARYVAKNIVAAGLADKCEIQLSYAIGISNPVSLSIDTFGTNKISNDEIISIIKKIFDLSPSGIINMLNLKNPIYEKTASFGHFGRTDVLFSWEKIDKIEEIKKLICSANKTQVIIF